MEGGRLMDEQGRSARVPVLAAVLFAAAIVLASFSYWGINTAAGRQAFDEMAGIIPYSAGLLSVILAALASLSWWLGRRHQE